MVYPLYVIRDVKVSYGTPYAMNNNDAAQRDFSFKLHNNEILGFSPSDYSLYRVGSYDTESGKITPEDPVFIVEGSVIF